MLVGWVLAIAAINWGLVGLVNVNLVETVFGSTGVITKVVYILIGLAGVYKVYMMTMSKKWEDFRSGIIKSGRF